MKTRSCFCTGPKNGTYILDIPGKPDGTIDRKERTILNDLAGWFAINGQAIYATRPWKVYGEGPVAGGQGAFVGPKIAASLGVGDVRFTRSKDGTTVYAIFLGQRPTHFQAHSLGLAADTRPGKILAVELLGSDEKLSWRQTPQSLSISAPRHLPGNYAHAFRVRFA